MDVVDLALFAAAIPLGIYAVAFGGGMFLALPLFQALQPNATLGAVIAAIKVGSLARGLASTWATRKQVRWRETVQRASPFALGGAGGAFLIADLPQQWLLLLIGIAIALSELAPRLASIVPRRARAFAAIATGVYGGVLGAGIGLLIVALQRLETPSDTSIVEVKIQARYIEFLMSIAALSVHVALGNLSDGPWAAWAAGSFVGGLLGGMLLNRLARASARIQRPLLLASYAVALLGALAALLI